MPLGTILGAIGSIGSGIIGGIAGGGDNSQAMQLQLEALERIKQINTPEAKELALTLERYVSAGELAPELQEIVTQQDTELKGIQTDPRLRNAQMQALMNLQQMGAGQLRPEDEAALSRIQGDVARDEQGRQQAILQNMQERGQGGSGAELAARLSSSQGASNRLSNQGMDIAAQASQRALQAIMNAGTLGGQMQATDFNQQKDVASAQDVINRYNSMNRQNVIGSNVSTKNQAQATNLSNKQGILNSNVDLSNKQQVYNQELKQKQFDNEMAKQKAIASASGDASRAHTDSAKRTADMFGTVGGGLQKAGTAFDTYSENQAKAAKEEAAKLKKKAVGEP
jgi:hypothetical protein